jgi:DNA-binding transcriptional ArsR family regulator
VKLELETIEAPVTCEALGLLVRMRARSDVAETDGRLDSRDLSALSAYFRISPRRLSALLAALKDAGLVNLEPNGARDVNFTAWCATRQEREMQRTNWAERKRVQTQNRPTSHRESRQESFRNPGGVREDSFTSLSSSLARLGASRLNSPTREDAQEGLVEGQQDEGMNGTPRTMRRLADTPAGRRLQGLEDEESDEL